MMPRKHTARLERIEAARGLQVPGRRYIRVPTFDPDEQRDYIRDALASGAAGPDDVFICRKIVSPPPRED